LWRVLRWGEAWAVVGDLNSHAARSAVANMNSAASVIHTWSFITTVDVVNLDPVKRVWKMEGSSKASTVQLMNQI
jgi:hypothetical protein